MAPGARVVLDTDVLIDFFSGLSPGADAVERLLAENRAMVTSVTLVEMACGARTGAQLEDLEMVLQGAGILEIDAAAALRAGAAWRELRARGTFLEPPDLLIAGCCMAAGLPLLTRSRRYYEHVRGLRLLDPERVLGPGVR
jgi:predicted nucleic acid-binding protein